MFILDELVLGLMLELTSDLKHITYRDREREREKEIYSSK